MVNNQCYLFIIFTLNGILIGIIFDFFRILRKSFNTKDFFTYIEDVCFWIITGIIIIYSMYKFCDGELRFFMILGLIIGILIYVFTISRFVMKVAVAIFRALKIILGVPFRLMYKVTKKFIFRPALFLFNKIIDFFNRIYNKNKKIGRKRGFFVKKENNNI